MLFGLSFYLPFLFVNKPGRGGGTEFLGLPKPNWARGRGVLQDLARVQSR